MNALDVILLVIIAVSMGAGLMKGLAREILSLAGVLLGILLALIGSPALADVLYRWIPFEGAAYGTAFLIIFLLTMLATGIIGVLVTRILDFAHLGFYNRILGGVFGFLRGTIIGLVLAMGLTLFMEPGSDFLEESRLTPRLGVGARGLAPLLPERIRGVLLDRLDELPRDDGTDLEESEPI